MYRQLSGMGAFWDDVQSTISNVSNAASQIQSAANQFNPPSSGGGGGGSSYTMAPATNFSANQYAPAPTTGMSTTTKVALAAGGAVLIGGIIYFATKKKNKA